MIRTLWALGVGASGPGYPNGAGLIALLSREANWNVRDLVRWLPEDIHLWRLGKGSMAERIRIIAHIAARAVFLPFDLVRARQAGATVFTPYPALFTLAVARCVPRRFRPMIIADCFISIWDSGFSDRKIASGSGRLAGVIKSIEAWCLRAADAVLVDTIENAEFVGRELAIEEQRIHVVPLSLDVDNLLELHPVSRVCSRPLRVLYVGTFVPLHGFNVIVSAMREMLPSDSIAFRIIGDGQEAQVLEAAIRQGLPCSVDWIREWLTAEELVHHYEWSDVCLGVFGPPGKANRVLPFKLYAALAAGRAVVTHASMGAPAPIRPPVNTCERSGASLAAALRRLSSKQDEVQISGLQGRHYFLENLSAHAIRNAWISMWIRMGDDSEKH